MPPFVGQRLGSGMGCFNGDDPHGLGREGDGRAGTSGGGPCENTLVPLSSPSIPWAPPAPPPVSSDAATPDPKSSSAARAGASAAKRSAAPPLALPLLPLPGPFSPSTAPSSSSSSAPKRDGSRPSLLRLRVSGDDVLTNGDGDVHEVTLRRNSSAAVDAADAGCCPPKASEDIGGGLCGLSRAPLLSAPEAAAEMHRGSLSSPTTAPSLGALAFGTSTEGGGPCSPTPGRAAFDKPATHP